MVHNMTEGVSGDDSGGDGVAEIVERVEEWVRLVDVMRI